MGIKEAIKKYQKRKAEKRGKEKIIREAEGKAYQEARVKEAQIYAVQRATIERKARVRALRAGGGGRGIGRGFRETINVAARNLGYDQGGIFGLGGRTPAPRAPKIKKGKTIKIKGRTYKLVSKGKKKRKRRASPQTYERHDPFGSSLF